MIRINVVKVKNASLFHFRTSGESYLFMIDFVSFRKAFVMSFYDSVIQSPSFIKQKQLNVKRNRRWSPKTIVFAPEEIEAVTFFSFFPLTQIELWLDPPGTSQ